MREPSATHRQSISPERRTYACAPGKDSTIEVCMVADNEGIAPRVRFQEMGKVNGRIDIKRRVLLNLNPQAVDFGPWMPDVLLCCHARQGYILFRFRVDAVGRFPVQDCADHFSLPLEFRVDVQLISVMVPDN